jgi:aspartyl-tRNA synthetase
MNRISIAETINHAGEKVKVSGWVNNWRAHGKILFIDLRDRSGLLQVVFATNDQNLYELAQTLRPEWVVTIEGKIKDRPKGMQNPKIETGLVEMEAENLEVLSQAKTLPFSIEGDGYDVGEEKRLAYRYLDIRRERMKNNLIQRQKAIHFIRNFLVREGFVEVETPILTKSTPEGARDFVVPARLQPGKFYALPQSPQQYKQLLMVAGLEKYFQIARCFRDEDPRADRQAEFTQLDIEMSFIEQEEILNLIESLYVDMVKNVFPEKRIQQIPFPRMTYQEAMEKYNSDKPDLRKDKNDANELAFCFIVDFPMFEWKKEENRWDAVHHPFTRPQTEDILQIKNKPDQILGYQYDLALNGYEIGGGSLRSYKPEVLETVFEVMGNKKENIKEKFGHLLEAFEYGVPPHGGMGCGLERFLSIVLNEPNIREVIAFPKTGDNRDLMMQSPSEIEETQLKELNIKTAKKDDVAKKNTN